MKSSRWENSFVFLTAALFFLYWAREFVSQTGFFAPEIVVRSGLASDLWADQISGRQGLLCSFWWPPLPTLLYLPPGWLPFPAKSFLPGLLITCLTGGLTAFFINRLAVRNEVPCWYRWLFLLLFCLHPWYRQIFSGTSSHGLLLTLLAATFYGFAGWSQERKIRYFLLLSISPALAIISSPAGIFLSVGVLLLLAVTSIRAGYPWRRQQAIMLLYLVPAVYCGGLWFLGNWIVMQDAGYFLRWVHWKNIFQEIFLSACGSCYHLTEAMLLLSAWMFGLLLFKLRNRGNGVCLLSWLVLHLILATGLYSFPAASRDLRRSQALWKNTCHQVRKDVKVLQKFSREGQLYLIDFSGYLFRPVLFSCPGVKHFFDLSRMNLEMEHRPAYLVIPAERWKQILPPDPFLSQYPVLPGQPTDFLLTEMVCDSFTIFRLILLRPKD